MELGSNTATAAAAAAEAETHTPTRLHHAKPLSFSSNGVLKRHNPLHHHHHHHRGFPGHLVTYKECLKNHAANLGGHAVDGCGEFMPSPSAAASASPTSLKCAACGCHRNFHRREPEETTLPALPKTEYQSHHRHHPPPPSPPPISSSAPHMLLALSTGFSGPPTDSNTPISAANPGRKRFRTKFTQDQKDRMLEFAEKVGWKIQKRDEDLINDFCTQVGVERGVLKVWMHNNKNNTLCKRDQSNAVTDNNVNALDFHIESSNNSENASAHVNAVNGSSSSS